MKFAYRVNGDIVTKELDYYRLKSAYVEYDINTDTYKLHVKTIDDITLPPVVLTGNRSDFPVLYSDFAFILDVLEQINTELSTWDYFKTKEIYFDTRYIHGSEEVKERFEDILTITKKEY